MSGFVATGEVQAYVLGNDGFWPEIDLNDLRASLRINSSVSNPRLETAVIAAGISLNRELSALKAKYQEQGYGQLAEVPAEQFAEQSELLRLYQRALYSAVGAEIAERYRSLDATNSGNRDADEEQPGIDDYRRDSRYAIRDLLGISRTTVELL